MIIKDQFDPFLDSYDLANLSQREAYVKMLVRGDVKDPFSIKTIDNPDIAINSEIIEEIYNISRTKYARKLLDAKEDFKTSQADVAQKIETFAEPII